MEILHGVSIDVNQGEIVSIIGPNGAPRFKNFMENTTHYPIVYLEQRDFIKECKEYQTWAEEHMKRIGMIQ